MKRLLALGLLLAAALSAQSLTGPLTGTWIGTIPAQGRAFARDIEIRLVQDGDQLTGKLYREGPGSPIVEGSIVDGKVVLVIDTREQAGNQINDMRYRFEGTLLDDGRIAMVREKISQRDAVSGAEIPVRRPQDDDEADRKRRFREFTMERLY